MKIHFYVSQNDCSSTRERERERERESDRAMITMDKDGRRGVLLNAKGKKERNRVTVCLSGLNFSLSLSLAPGKNWKRRKEGRAHSPTA